MLETFPMLEPVILFFRIHWWIKTFKEQNLFKTEIFFNNLFFTITFYQFNTSLLNKGINLFQ